MKFLPIDKYKNFFKQVIIYLMQLEARAVLWRYRPKIIAITGSVGKTSTKDAVYAVLAKIAYVRKSEKSFNSEIGLPLTILGCPNGWYDPIVWLTNLLKGLWLIVWPHKYPQWLVLEVGIGKPGDMKKTAGWLKTDAVIMTAIGQTPAHIEFFDSRKHLIDEKARLIKTLKKDGLLILNNDDEAIAEMRDRTKSRVITYGFNSDSVLRASADTIFYNQAKIPEGIIYRIDEGNVSLPVQIEGVFGRNHVYASLAALAFSSGFKFNMVNAINQLKNYEVPAGRMRLLKGINNSFIIDDTYNSSPFACQSALKTLAEVQTTGRKIAVLGDMLELGKYTKEAHENIGQMTKEMADVLITVGLRAEVIKEGALSAGLAEKNIFSFKDSKEAGEFLKTLVQAGDLILIKGSQGMRMEFAVATILEDQKNKNKLLVRQDKEWQKK